MKRFLNSIAVGVGVLAMTSLSANAQQDVYAKTSNAAISGFNDKIINNVTVDQCKSACNSETSFVCKSFDYAKAKKRCDLSKESRDTKTLKTNYPNNPYDHYSRYVFDLTQNAAIRGHNTKNKTNVTPQQCQSACVNETSFTCKSIDYYKASKSCDLSDKSASDVGGLKTNYAGNPYDHYALATPTKAKPFTMAVLSDTQVGYCKSDLCTSDDTIGIFTAPKSSEKANEWHSNSIAKLKAQSSNFSGLIINGDLTNTMDPDELDDYIKYYAHKFRTFSGLGNHDYENYVKGDSKTCGAGGITHGCAQDMIKFLAQDVNATAVAKDFSFYTHNDDIWGSLVYYWDIGNYRFIQLNNHPDYEVGFDTAIWGGLELDNVSIGKGWADLKKILDKPDSAGKNIILNMHVILTGSGDDAMGQYLDGGIQQDADLQRLNRDFLEVYPNIRAIFGGHLHDHVAQSKIENGITPTGPNLTDLSGERKQIETPSGRIVPVLFGGSAETNHYMEVIFKQNSFEANVIWSGSGNLTRTGTSTQVTW